MSLRSRGVSALLPILLVLIAVLSTTAANRDDSGGDVTSKHVQAAGEEPTAQTGEVIPTLGHLSEAQALKLPPMFREIHEILVQEQAQTRDLMAQLEGIRDPLAALDIQKEISLVKELTEISILEVQANYARMEGRSEQVQEIEDVLVQLRSRLDRRMTNEGRGQ